MAKPKQVDIVLQKPLAHQRAVMDDDMRFKVLRWGRRCGKTRIMHLIAGVGHGPIGDDGRPFWPGFLLGGKVCWLSRDNPQMEMVWREEMKARYKGRAGIHWREQDKIVEMQDGAGFLDLRSAENVDSVRGQDYDIVVIDETAYFDFDHAWRKVIRPTLVDRKGSGVICSTTRAGSAFNELCERIRAGNAPPTWKEYYGTAFDNPRLDPVEIQEMIDEYPPGSRELEEEVWAKLVTIGGLAFAEWRDDLHVYKMEPPEDWPPVACLDWGYHNPGCFHLVFGGPDKELYVRWEYYFRETPPADAGFSVGLNLMRWPLPRTVVADSSMWAMTQGPVTIAELFQNGLTKACGPFAPTLIPAPKGPGSRETRKVLMHEALKWKPHPQGDDKPVPAWLAPRLRFHPDCHNAIRTIPKLNCDEKEPDKVDTLAEDHAYDAITYLLISRTPHVERRSMKDEDYELHPGFSSTGTRKKKWEEFWEDEPTGGATYQRPFQRWS